MSSVTWEYRTTLKYETRSCTDDIRRTFCIIVIRGKILDKVPGAPHYRVRNSGKRVHKFFKYAHQAELDELHGDEKVHRGDVLSTLMLALILVIRAEPVWTSGIPQEQSEILFGRFVPKPKSKSSVS